MEIKNPIQKNEKEKNVWTGIYNKPLKELIIPYSKVNLEKIEKIAAIHSGFFQNIIFYNHNYFEIRLLVDTFNQSSPEEMETLSAEHIEGLFVQWMAVYEISQSIEPNVIDFSKFRILPGYGIQFPIALPLRSLPQASSAAKKETLLKNILQIFQKNRHFKDLNEKNAQETFHRLRATRTFDKNHAYMYRYDDFASNILNAFPISRLKSDTNIKIKIKTTGPVQEKIIKINLYNNHIFKNEDVFFAPIDSAAGTPETLPYRLARLLPGKPDRHTDEEDFISIINRLNLFLKKSSFKSVVLMTGHIKSKEDAEFINYLFHSSGISNIRLICIDTTWDSENPTDFDLELKEKPDNLMERFLKFDKTDREKEPGKDEKELLKILSTLPVPISRGKLEKLVSPHDPAVIENLINRNFLRIRSGNIALNTNLPALNIKITAEEEKKILKSLLKKGERENIDLLSVKISYYIKTRQFEKLKAVLDRRLQAGGGFEADLAGIKAVSRENPGLLEKDIRLKELFVEVLLAGNDLERAKALLLNYTNKDCPKGTVSLKLKLKLAYIYKMEKDLQKMGELLTEIKEEAPKPMPKPLQDEYHYLAYIYFEKVSDLEEADRNRKKIKSDLYRKRAALQLSGRYIYRRLYKQAAALLSEAIDYFKEKKYLYDEIEAKSRLAKLYREQQAFEKAEVLYKNIFIKSEMKNYRLLSGYISVDLGNLYWLQDNFKQADAWYNKALDIFQNLENKNGVMLTKFNRVEINKIKGNWQEAKDYLVSCLAYDKKNNAAASLAFDYYNIAHLEYLRHNYSRAGDFIKIAGRLFKKENNRTYIIECEIFKLELALLNPNVETLQIHTGFFTSPGHRLNLNHDQKAVLSVMETVHNDPAFRKSGLIVEKTAQIASKTLRFRVVFALIHRYQTWKLLELLKSLSMVLSKEMKNYYYYEYYYTHYSLFSGETRIEDDEKERFNEMYYFFLRNQRKISTAIIRHKRLLDEEDARYDIFKSAELVRDSNHWKLPEDFFNSLVNELGKTLTDPMESVRLVIYEKEKQEPLFDFSTAASAPERFDALTREMIAAAIAAPAPLNLKSEEIRKRYKSSEKAFYPYKNTRVTVWKISEHLTGILLLGFPEEEYDHYDFHQRSSPLLDKFASLIDRYYKNDFKLNQKLGFIIGESPAVKELKEKILKVSKVDFSVLIRGESGSGKELVANAVHLLSSRWGKSFVAVNAAAIPENLLEAELFGYKKGAFTGADKNKTGLIETADNGTLFLDEIADLPLNLQAKLLRVLQENEIRRLGENKTVKVNIRLLSATNKDLKELIAKNCFREDLYFRIQDLTVDVPPLRERRTDIPLLVYHFFNKYGFSVKDKEELQRIIAYFKNRNWTGNVRELESSVKRLITYYPDIEIDMYDDDDENGEEGVDGGLLAARDNLERTMALKALRENNWNKVEAAAALKITRQYLFRLIRKYGLE